MPTVSDTCPVSAPLCQRHGPLSALRPQVVRILDLSKRTTCHPPSTSTASPTPEARGCTREPGRSRDFIKQLAKEL
jgi:hypothetical protein